MPILLDTITREYLAVSRDRDRRNFKCVTVSEDYFNGLMAELRPVQENDRAWREHGIPMDYGTIKNGGRPWGDGKYVIQWMFTEEFGRVVQQPEWFPNEELNKDQEVDIVEFD